MILHWTEAGSELFALYREREGKQLYIVCQFDPFPTFHEALTGDIKEYGSNEELEAVREGDPLPEDIVATLVQNFSFPGGERGDGKPTAGS